MSDYGPERDLGLVTGEPMSPQETERRVRDVLDARSGHGGWLWLEDRDGKRMSAKVPVTFTPNGPEWKLSDAKAIIAHGTEVDAGQIVVEAPDGEQTRTPWSKDA